MPVTHTIGLSIGRHYVERVNIMKPREVNQDMSMRHAGAVIHDPARIQGGNWKMQGFRRSGHDHDEAECQMSIAEFMAGQEFPQDSFDG
jgi:hypothetical protein